MKKLHLLSALLLVSCSSFKSGLIIPANQTFILGEYNDKNYSAQLKNKSNFTVILKAIDKNSGTITQSFGLGAKGKTKIYIDKNETVYLKNVNKTDAKIDVILSKGVEGMRYIDNN
tara:strand:+ start:504 stop:851 length:348 start_codon:yes stop_codon:yes gene_type:complete